MGYYTIDLSHDDNLLKELQRLQTTNLDWIRTIRFKFGGRKKYDDDDYYYYYNNIEQQQQQKQQENLNTILNVIYQYSIQYGFNLEKIMICDAIDPEIVRIILCQFVQKLNPKTIQTLIFEDCYFSTPCFEAVDMNIHYYTNITDYDSNNNHNIISSTRKNHTTMNRSILLVGDCILIDSNNNNNNNNDNNITSVIEKCSFFSSCCPYEEMILILNGLTNNNYIHSLQVTCIPTTEEDFQLIIDAITNVVTATRTLSKLALENVNTKYCSNKTTIYKLSEALIQSESITDLSLQNFKFDNMESFRCIRSVLEYKTNIKSLKVDMTILTWRHNRQYFDLSAFFHLIDNDDDDDNNTRRNHDLPIPRIFHNVNKNENQFISSCEILKHSQIEHLSIEIDGEYEQSMYKRLFVNTIGFMSQLRSFQCIIKHNDLFEQMKNTYVQSIAQCNINLLKVKILNKYQREYYHNDWSVTMNKFLERNRELTTCIKKKTKIHNIAWPKIFCSFPQFRKLDITFRLLCDFDLQVGPNIRAHGDK